MRFWLATLIFFGMAFEAAWPFGTIRTGGQNAEHERITRAALSSELGPATLDSLAGKNGTFGAVGAPDRPLRGLMGEASAHCDGGDFLEVPGYPQLEDVAAKNLEKCRDWIFLHMEAAIKAAADLADPTPQNTALDCPFDGETGSAKCMVLDHLGVALHAAQDFYSHSNWVDEPRNQDSDDPKHPPGLENSGRAKWIDPGVSEADVPEDLIFPQGLISGCYDGYPEALHCNYGYGLKNRVKHDYLNKDTGPIGADGTTGPGTTDRGKVNGNFQRAVATAIDDTKAKWAYFEEQLHVKYGVSAPQIICAMKSDTGGDDCR